MSKELDILAIHPSCVVGTNRGILRELLKRGFSVELVVPKEDSRFNFNSGLDPSTSDDPPIHALKPMFSIQPSRKRTFSGLRELIASKRPRYIWIEDEPASLLAWQLGLLKRVYGFELICFSVENMELSLLDALRSSQSKRYVRHEVLGVLTRISRVMADKVLVCSRDGEHLMNKRGFRNAVLRTPIGYDPELFRVDQTLRKETRKALGLKDYTIAYFGRVVPEKGIEDLVAALGELKGLEWQLLLDRFADYENPFSKVLEEAIEREGIKGRVVYFDARHDEMPRFMNAADLVVAPSRNTPMFKEQYGRVVPEALACGCDVIVTRAGALPELVGDEGHVVEADNRAELVGKIRERIARGSHLDRSSRAQALTLVEQANLLEQWLR